MARTGERGVEMIDVRGANARATSARDVRRWVWSGRLAAQRQGNRLLIARADVEAIAFGEGRPPTSLATWADRARAVREATGAMLSGSSAAELVIEDRTQRSRPAEARAGR